MQNNIVKLRAVEPNDLELLLEWENDTKVWQVSNTTLPYSKYIMEQYIADAGNDIYATKQTRFMIDCIESGKTVGCIDIFDFEPLHKRAGIGILIDEEHRNNGYATHALDLIINYAFKILDMHQLYSNVPIDNEASLKLFQHKGFGLTATKKDWIRRESIFVDEYFLQLINK